MPTPRGLQARIRRQVRPDDHIHILDNSGFEGRRSNDSVLSVGADSFYWYRNDATGDTFDIDSMVTCGGTIPDQLEVGSGTSRSTARRSMSTRLRRNVRSAGITLGDAPMISTTPQPVARTAYRPRPSGTKWRWRRHGRRRRNGPAVRSGPGPGPSMATIHSGMRSARVRQRRMGWDEADWATSSPATTRPNAVDRSPSARRHRSRLLPWRHQPQFAEPRTG